MKKRFTLITWILMVIGGKCLAQTMSVGDYSESLARMNQLLGISDDLSSFTQHPLNSAFNSKGDSSLQNMVAGKSIIPKFSLLGIPSSIRILPFTWLSDYNSTLPYGYNNSSLYPNVGYQTRVTGGLFIRIGILNVQLKPELVHAENDFFNTFAEMEANYSSPLIPAFFSIINGSDAPERFGTVGIDKAYLGQSKITLNYANLEAGVSTENLWWGPGVQNSIMMSNSAPGFFHWTFNTVNPIKTYIGSFEWQIIGGILNQSGYAPYSNNPPRFHYGYDDLYSPKPKVTRYLSAFTANWHPKWLPGFFVGISGYNYMNRDSAYDKKSFAKRLFPVLMSSSFNAATNEGVGGDGQDFAYALNMRQVFVNAHAEIYFEWARNDGVVNFRDFVLQPEHSIAYTLGAGRIFELNPKNFIQVRTELTHLQDQDTFLLRAEPNWYVHQYSNPRDGYTNDGRWIGAGIGPGSNSLMVDLRFIRGLSSAGYKFERYVHDNDLYYNAFQNTPYFNDEWVDIDNTFYANIKLKKFLVSAEYTFIDALNYEYIYHGDVSNRHWRLTVTYFFD